MKNKEKFLELTKNDDFLNAVLNLETSEEMQAKFLENEVEIGISEVMVIRKVVDNIIAKGTIELSPDDLDKIIENAIELSQDDLGHVVGGTFDVKDEILKRGLDDIIDYVMRKIFTGLDKGFDYAWDKSKKARRKWRSRSSSSSTSTTAASQKPVSR